MQSRIATPSRSIDTPEIHMGGARDFGRRLLASRCKRRELRGVAGLPVPARSS
jgi:hypothetical protein